MEIPGEEGDSKQSLQHRQRPGGGKRDELECAHVSQMCFMCVHLHIHT